MTQVYVHGRPRWSTPCAVAAWARGEVPRPSHEQRFARPSPRLAEARWLAEHGATAAIDISDGLITDLGRLMAASGVAAEVDIDRIPAIGDATPTDAARGGEEYELVVTGRHETSRPRPSSRQMFDLRLHPHRRGLVAQVCRRVVTVRSRGIARRRRSWTRSLFAVMRTLLTAVVTVIVTFVCATTVIIARLFECVRQGPRQHLRAVHAWLGRARWYWAAGVRLHVHGAEHIQHDTGAVYISNHVSWFDVFSLAALLPRSTFIAKRELRRIPLFGKGAEYSGIIFLDRENRKAAFESYRSGRQPSSDEGRSLVVCPEGTRGADYHLRPFKKGPFVLAIAAGASIVPTVVYGAREIMPKGSFRVRARGDVHVHFLEAIPTAGKDYRDRGALMEEVWGPHG